MGILLFVLPFVCSFFFLSKFFVKDLSTTVKDRNFIFGIQVHNDKLYRGIEMGLLLFVLPYICSFFFLSRFSSKISPQLLKIETSNLVYSLTTTSCIVGLQKGLVLFVLPYICSFFFLSRFFVRFGIEVHNDNLDCGIANGHYPICSSLYLFLFLSLQIFRLRYLHNYLR